MAILGVIIIPIVSYSLFFYLQLETEENIQDTLFDQQMQRQLDSTRGLSQHVSSDFELVQERLRTLAGSIAEISSEEGVENLAQETHGRISEIADRLYVIDDAGIIRLHIGAGEDFEGQDASSLSFVSETRSTMQPAFSTGFVSLDGELRIAITYPIKDPAGDYQGLVAATLPVKGFFERYGNLYDINSQYLAALDKEANYLTTAVPELPGKNFYSEQVQQIINRNKEVNDLIATALSGREATTVVDWGRGERLATGYPVMIGGQMKYVIFLVTPTQSIYSQIDAILLSQRTATLSLITGMAVSAILLIILLLMWNSTLNRTVESRTHELKESNKSLASAYEQLQEQDRAQREFVDVAAHELRTPIMPILSSAKTLRADIESIKDQLEESVRADIAEDLDMIHRNASRLQRLAENILYIVRIESGQFKLRMQNVGDFDSIIASVARDVHKKYGNRIPLALALNSSHPSLAVRCDSEKIRMALFNLIDNAFKFTEEDRQPVSISSNIAYGPDLRLTPVAGPQEEHSEPAFVVVTIKDRGRGVDPGFSPRLFEKFASKSESGTGLGLFIAKSIIEAHGGKVWSEDNKGERGATFAFAVPMVKKLPAIPT